jgi:hypothetical protein
VRECAGRRHRRRRQHRAGRLGGRHRGHVDQRAPH